MNEQHTPGEWQIDEGADGAWAVYVDPMVDMGVHAVIASRGQWTHRAAESKANARLIAAAPCLLEATKLLLDALTGNQLGCTQFESLKKQARAAIARALPQGAPK